MLVENSPDSHKPVETGDGSLSGPRPARSGSRCPALHPATNSARVPGPTHAVSRVPPPHDGHGAARQVRPLRFHPACCAARFSSDQVITPRGSVCGSDASSGRL